MLDLSPVTVSGPITAARARAIWHDGRLAVFTTRDDVQTITAERPVRGHGSWTAATDDGPVVVTKAGCSCGFGLARVPRATLLAAIPAPAPS